MISFLLTTADSFRLFSSVPKVTLYFAGSVHSTSQVRVSLFLYTESPNTLTLPILVPFSTINFVIFAYSFFSHATNKSSHTSILPSVSIIISLLNTPADKRSIGADLPLLNFIVAEVTMSLVAILNVTFVPAFIVLPGIT